ncbi:DUF1499 domain-containing protein [Rhodobacterales bacterium]|nr:DUF1499 domain-containing protein [Rhodobacterales bacterium]
MKRYAVHRTALAPASRKVGGLALALSVSAFLAKRFGFIDEDIFVLSLIVGAGVALVAVALALFAFQRIWSLGGPGVPSALTGTLLGLLAFAPPALVLAMLVAHGHENDLSTDFANPPEMKQVSLEEDQPFLGWLNRTMEDRIWPLWAWASDEPVNRAEALEDQELYPDIVPRRYRIPPAQLHVAGAKAVSDLGWRVVDELPPDLLDAPTRLQAEGITRVLGLKYDVVLRVRPDPVGALLDIRSRSRTGLNDLTDNADHIRTVLSEIDRVLLATYGDLARLSVEESETDEDDLPAEPLEEKRKAFPIPGFKPYFEEDDGPVGEEDPLDLEG